ncbi:MAG TPA: MoaD/ThiS family protein [Planctomycetaceae bacterium]|jgi:hypothetical protein|nr:MoaD/ThiS family protein [Planctomycetaceae bacterium]
MPRVFFTSHLQQHQRPEPADVSGRTVAEVMAAVFERQPELRGYVLDDQGRVRQHVMIFVDDVPLSDRETLDDRLTETSQIYVMQALSGG